MKGDTLSLSLVASFVIHGVVILLAAIVIRNTGNLRRENYLPVDLVEVPRRTEVKPVQKPEPPPEIKNRHRLHRHQKSKRPSPLYRRRKLNPSKPSRFHQPLRGRNRPSRSRRKCQPNRKHLPRMPPPQRSKAAAAKTAPGIFSAKAMSPLCLEQGRQAEAEAPRLPG